MDPATVIALCKENIQPLRHGRNVAQLGTALRAQEDAEAQQLLLQERQVHEEAIKNYVGDDPLENWYDYILWMEQSYPKSGQESHISRLLQECLAAFEKETKYHQDRRYIRLWINYISMQKNPIELYQLLHNNGIGTMVADMYRAWAFELEQIEDYKRADEVYLMGLTTRAEPLDELDCAHKNFQLAVARKMLGRSEGHEVSFTEQRQAFSSLKAIKVGRKVGSVRTGHRIHGHMPGVIPQSDATSHSTNQNSRVQIYQDDALSNDGKGSSILVHVPVEANIHKENTLKPGPWNAGFKKCPLISSSVKTSFKVHEDQPDDDFSLEKVKLFPNHTPFYDGSKYEEYPKVPVYVSDPPNSNVILKPHYPKELVYANNIDRSMEEIRAQQYLERCEQSFKQHHHQMSQSQLGQQEINRSELSVQQEMHHQLYSRGKHQLPNQGQKLEQLEIARHHSDHLNHERQQREELSRLRYESEQLEFKRLEAERLEQQRYEAEKQEYKRLEAERLEAERIEAERMEAERMEVQRIEAERMEAERMEVQRIEAERIEAERIEAERIEAQRMEAELRRQQKLQSSSFLNQQSSSTASEEHLLGQSLTVNTKEAMSAVQELWQSPNTSNNSPMISRPLDHRMADTREKLSFNIHMDSSMTQHAMSTSKHHQGYSVPIQTYNDQENNQVYHSPFTSQEHQSFGGHAVHNPYHYQVQHMGTHQQGIQPHLQSHVQQHQLQTSIHQPHIHHTSHMQSPHQQHMEQHLHVQPQHNQAQLLPSHHIHMQHHTSHIQSLHDTSQHMQHMEHQQHQQHHMYGNVVANMGYQQYSPALQSPLPSIEPQKQLHFSPYTDPESESNKSYKMPTELPYIKSPGMNRRDLKFLESAENKENALCVEYNGPVEENMVKQEENLYEDETLGTAPLAVENETCITEAFNTHLTSSTPINHFKESYRVKERHQLHGDGGPPPTIPEVQVADTDDKLSVIMESTKEYISSSSGSSMHTRTTTLGFTLTREDLGTIKETSSPGLLSNDTLLAANQTYDQNMRAKIQAVHAQSPRTVQRNVDQITSEIQINCDLKKSINFNLNNEPYNNEISDEKVNTMEYEEQEPMEEVEEEVFELPEGNINPFDKNLIAGLLRKIKFPQSQHAEGYVRLNCNLNKFVPSTMITLGNQAYDLDKCLGKGTYGKVFKAVDLQTRQTVALKTQKPAWVWEFYIAREIKARLTNPYMLRGFMDIQTAYVADNSSVLVSEYSKYGTLLSVTNQVKVATGKPLHEALAIFFTIEMLHIVEYLHKCQIIHGDIKPDNFLLMHLPTEDARPTIQLIDFGCSIDMSQFPENTKFMQVIKTEEFTCIEMQTGKPWTYQTDLYCLAASSHCLLFGSYMRVSNSGGRWFINSKIPRYAKRDAWEKYFTDLLNIESCDRMPDLPKLRNIMEEALSKVSERLAKIRSFCNVLNNR
ncbi:uncharacterized protein LOC122512290 isoform X2 [Leptopilina heterotoma]|uniref:uncharacterized protein LOC122512290 isoform X2 n=1 Tax=Leptopilina heterotoma TaxID=63436 RepID=UPI001CA7DE5A|nr:uncharacterized protein LOC122512290 isoform X2 [Leptopilina heterotoma]